MSVFKSQFARALQVIPSDYCNIPFPEKVVEGVNISVYQDSLIAGPSINFIASNVAVGDIVYNITDGTAATITNVVSENVLELNYNAFVNVDAEFIIYAASPQTSIGVQGCNLYVAGVMNPTVKVTTLGQDEVTLPIGATGVIPLQVTKVHQTGTSATTIIALW